MFGSRSLAVPGRSGTAPAFLLLIIACGAAPVSRADEASDIASAKSLSRAVRVAFQRVAPTVVKIKATLRPPTFRSDPAPTGSRLPPGSPVENLFGGHGPGSSPSDTPPQVRLGSGVIIDAKGLILTNYRVVEGAAEVLVELSDGRQFRAADVKADEPSDLAVLRIKADRSLPAATLGDSDKLELGDWVLAIGHPFDLDVTVSAGIVSGTARMLPSGRRAEYLRTDAAINPGGPLVSLDGEVVGIGTALASGAPGTPGSGTRAAGGLAGVPGTPGYPLAGGGGRSGIGLVIPANRAKWVARQLIEKGSVQRAYLGVRIEEIHAEPDAEPAIAAGKGVLVVEVFPDGPAAKAGLRKNDRILKFAGHEVRAPRQLQELVEQTGLGTSQTVQIIRDGKPQAVQVMASLQPKSFGLAGRILQDPQLAASSAVSGLGLTVADLTKADIDRFAYAGFKGALVKEVEPAGLAARAGIRSGMLIMQVDKRTVRSAAEFHQALKNQPLTKGVMLLLRTPEGGNRLVPVRKE